LNKQEYRIPASRPGKSMIRVSAVAVCQYGLLRTKRHILIFAISLLVGSNEYLSRAM